MWSKTKVIIEGNTKNKILSALLVENHPSPKKQSIRDPKSKSDYKTKTILNVRNEGNIENKSCCTI